MRSAQIDDVERLAALHVAAWRAGYEGLLPQPLLDGLQPEQRYERWRTTIAAARWPAQGTLVAVRDEQVLGFADLSPAHPPLEPSAGEIRSFYIDPACWRRGIGRALLSAAVETLAEAGRREIVLWVLAGNERAIAFYAAHGFRLTGERKPDVVAGQPILDLLMRRSDQSM